MRQQETERRRLELERKQKAMELQIAALRAEFSAEAEAVERTIGQDKRREMQLRDDLSAMARVAGRLLRRRGIDQVRLGHPCGRKPNETAIVKELLKTAKKMATSSAAKASIKRAKPEQIELRLVACRRLSLPRWR